MATVQATYSSALQEVQDVENGLAEIREKLKTLLQQNDRVSDIERLPRTEFAVDTEARDALQEEGRLKAIQLRKELVGRNETTERTCAKLKAQCWDNMRVHATAVEPFKCTNYNKHHTLPQPSRTKLKPFPHAHAHALSVFPLLQPCQKEAKRPRRGTTVSVS